MRTGHKLYRCNSCGFETDEPWWEDEPIRDDDGEIYDEVTVPYCPECEGIMFEEEAEE